MYIYEYKYILDVYIYIYMRVRIKVCIYAALPVFPVRYQRFMSYKGKNVFLCSVLHNNLHTQQLYTYNILKKYIYIYEKDV